MSRNPSPHTPHSKLNRMTPAASEVKLGDLCVDLVTISNAEQVDLANLRAQVNSGLLSNAALAIHGAASPVVKAGSVIVAIAGGVIVTKVANTDLSALAGVLATAKSAAWAFYIDGSGNLTTSVKTADSANSAAALALLPAPAPGLAMIGFITIDNATGANFTGGTTALDTGSLTVTYYNSVGPTPFATPLTSVQIQAVDAR